jgi:hypothetical protein
MSCTTIAWIALALVVLAAGIAVGCIATGQVTDQADGVQGMMDNPDAVLDEAGTTGMTLVGSRNREEAACGARDGH